MEKPERLAAFLATGMDPDHPEERTADWSPAHVLRRIRTRALRYGMDPDMVDRALMNYLASFEPVRRSREPGEDDE